MSVRRLFVAAWAVAGLVVLASTVAAGGATRANGTFVDAAGNSVGWVQLVEDGRGLVHVNVHVEGMSPGKHGIHIHAIGSCSPTFAAAGPHYNPLGRQHGSLNPLGAHAGDLPNLIVNEDGIGMLSATTSGVTLSAGPTTLFDDTPGAVGSAFIIHMNEDDLFTDATNGNSGARIACAVIEAERPG
jgi:Cu-Zn family superoxide dismutase